MSAYYSENDPFAAAWLRELMRDGLIADGYVDERSIADVRPIDVKGFTQCHFFAGIGVWSLALRVAGWPDDRPVWTGSAPCQPFSAAGKGAGFDDERHLWPAWYHLIAHGKRHDCPVLGEQVAAKAGRAWFDLVSSDMEALDHGCGAVDTCAASLGAPFIGQRLYWLASATRSGSQGFSGRSAAQDERIAECGGDERLASTSSLGSGHRSELGGTARANQNGKEQRQWIRDESVAVSNDSRLASPSSARPQGPAWSNGAIQRIVRQQLADDCCASERLAAPSSGQSGPAGLYRPGWQHRQQPQDAGNRNDGGVPLHPVEYWRDAEWLLCRDPNGARFRPVESSSQRMAYDRSLGRTVAESSGAYQSHFPLVEAKEYKNRLNEIRGFGNALNISQAACFVEAVMEHLDA